MAMPRPLGKAQKIAEEVVPGLKSKNKSCGRVKDKSPQILSDVEIMQTRNIENKEGLK